MEESNRSRSQILEERNLAVGGNVWSAFVFLFTNIWRIKNRLSEKRQYNIFPYAVAFYSKYNRVFDTGIGG